MKIFKIVLILLLIFLALLIGLTVAAASLSKESKVPEFTYLLGQIAPDNFLCQEEYDWNFEHPYFFRYCDLKDNPTVSLLVDSNRSITKSYLFTYSRKLTIGDLIGQWGSPIGYKEECGYANYQWPDRYAFGTSDNFSPYSKISFIVLGSEEEDFSPWKGFVLNKC